MALMKTRRGALAGTVAGNALYPLLSQGALTLSAGVITDVTRLAGVEGDGEASPFGGVYVGPAATNIQPFSNDFANASWTGDITKTSTTTLDPGGGATALLATMATGQFVRNGNITVVAETTYTFFFWAKKGTAVGASYRVRDVSNAADIVANTNYASSINTSTFARISVTFTTPVGCTAIWCYPISAGTTGTIIVGWPMVVLGTIPVPYVPTTSTTPVTRAAGSVQGAIAAVNATQGWMFARLKSVGFAAAGPGYTARLFFAGDSTTNLIEIAFTAGTGWYASSGATGGAANQTATVADASLALGDARTIGGRWVSDRIYASVGGSAWGIGAARTEIPTLAATTFEIGSMGSVVAGRQIASSIAWVAIGTGTLTDADAALFYSWGNNDPLPHMFPRSAQLTFLAHFNGDGTAYRYKA